MRRDEIRDLVRRQPFEPIELGLSDARSVVIRHPGQIVIAERHVIVGLAQIKRGRTRVATPTDGEAIAKDWMLLDTVHIVSAEPADGNTKRRGRRGPRPRKR